MVESFQTVSRRDFKKRPSIENISGRSNLDGITEWGMFVGDKITTMIQKDRNGDRSGASDNRLDSIIGNTWRFCRSEIKRYYSHSTPSHHEHSVVADDFVAAGRRVKWVFKT